MGLLSRITFGLLGGDAPASIRTNSRVFQARYDAARTTDENRKHWANADDYSANAANSPDVRRLLRRRSRYECSNNGYLGGTVRTQAEDLVGTGPRVQLNIPGREPEARSIAKQFRKWCDATTLAEKLVVMDEARRRDGEVFAVLTTNDSINHPVKLDVKLIETDQVAASGYGIISKTNIDGIELDRAGNPISYRILRDHPGDQFTDGQLLADEVRAENVLHWFRPNRPRQARGIPETTAALPLGAILRRYTLAVLGSAEWAANIFGVMKSTAAPATDDAPSVDAMDRVEYERGALLTLPPGWDASQFQPDQPTSSYKEFKGEILNEMGRGQGVPFNVIAGNSSGYNYSSGRLDHLPYHRSVRITRNLLRLRVLDPLFRAWVAEYQLIPEAEGGPVTGLPSLAEWEWSWNWDGFDSIDPMKDAETDASRLKSKTTTYAEIYAAYGQDWEEQIRQFAREAKLIEELGLPATDAPPAGPAPAPSQQTQQTADPQEADTANA